MSQQREYDSEFDDLAQIECAIRAAGQYVQPSAQLRPITLQAAREQCADRRAEGRLGGFLVVVLFLSIMTPPLVQRLDRLRIRMDVPSAAQIQRQAFQYETRSEVGAHWGLAEVFTRLRQTQSERFGKLSAK